MRRAIGAALVVLLVGCSGGGDTSTSVADDVGARQAALPTTTTQATTTVAPASQLLEVPDLVGRTVDYAEGALAAVGLVLVVETREEADGEAGVIFEQLPEAGGEVTPASPIVVRIPASTTSATSTTRPATTTRPASTSATTRPATTTTAASNEEFENGILLADYVWGPSEKTKSLQALLGLDEDGWYGPETSAAHVEALTRRKLSIAGIPTPPITTTTIAPTTTPVPTSPPTPTTTAAPTTSVPVVPSTTLNLVVPTTSAVVSAESVPPSIPRNVLVGTPYWNDIDYSVDVAWSAPADSGSSGVGYYIVAVSMYTEATGVSDASYLETEGTETTMNVYGLTVEPIYLFQVVAMGNDGSFSDWTEAVTSYVVVATTTTQVLPDAPGQTRDLVAVPGNGQLALSWIPPFGGGTPSGYLLVWREYGTSTWNEVEVAGTSYTITGLTNYASYEFTVVAFNDGGYGDWAIASLSAPVQYPDATFPSKAPLMICWEMTQQSDFVDGEYLPALGTVTYSWSEALDDGGAPLVEYLVEYRDADFTRPQQAYSSPGLIVVSNMGVFGVASMFISVTNAAGFTSYNSVSSLPSMNYTTETYEDVCETSSRP